MFSVYVIVFECVIIIFFGAFVRLNDALLTNISNFTGSLVLILGFAMVSLSRKLLSWTSIGNLLVLLAVNFQWNLLWYQLWKSCFNGFNVTFGIQSSLLINCISCSLCCLLSFTDFIGRISWRQLLIISLVQSIGFSLNSAVITYGIKAFDGGGGIQTFMLSGVYSLSMWFIAFRTPQATTPPPKAKHTYPGITFSIIGLLLIVFGWPSYNQGGSLLSQSVADDGARSILAQCAFINTLLTLSAAIISAFLYHSPQSKMKVSHFVDAVINGGIIMASSTDVLLNPAAGLVLGAVASIGTMTLLKYYQNTFVLEVLPSSVFKGGFGFLSGIFAAIIVAARNNTAPTLTSNVLITGALDLAAIALTLGIGLLFGVGSGFILKYLPGPNKEDLGQDRIMWEVQYESLPLYLADEIPADIINTNRLQNPLMSRPENDSRLQTYKKDSQKSLKEADARKSVDYVPPPSGASPKGGQPSLINRKPIAPKRVNSVTQFDVKKPGSPMLFEENKIKELEEEYNNASYRNAENVEPPNIIRRLNYDENEIVREGGVSMPN